MGLIFNDEFTLVKFCLSNTFLIPLHSSTHSNLSVSLAPIRTHFLTVLAPALHKSLSNCQWPRVCTSFVNSVPLRRLSNLTFKRYKTITAMILWFHMLLMRISNAVSATELAVLLFVAWQRKHAASNSSEGICWKRLFNFIHYTLIYCKVLHLYEITFLWKVLGFHSNVLCVVLKNKKKCEE